MILHRHREKNFQLIENYCFTLDYDQYYPVTDAAVEILVDERRDAMSRQRIGRIVGYSTAAAGAAPGSRRLAATQGSLGNESRR